MTDVKKTPDAPSAPTPDQVESERKRIAASGKEKLQKLKSEVGGDVAPAVIDSAKEIVKDKNLPLGDFSVDNLKSFFNGLDGKFSELDAEKKKAYKAYIFDELIGKIVGDDALRVLLADDSDRSILVDVNLNKGSIEVKIKNDPANNAKYDAAKKKFDEAASQAAKDALAVKPASVAEGIKGVDEFAKDHPEAAGYLVQYIFGGDKQKMQQAMNNVKSMWGFLFGIFGYGAGAGFFGKLRENEKFAPYFERGSFMLADMTDGIFDLRPVFEIKDVANFDKLFSETLLVRKQFHTSIPLKLSNTLSIASIKFADDCQLTIADGSKSSFKKGQVYKKVVLSKGEEIPKDSVFRDVEMEKKEEEKK